MCIRDRFYDGEIEQRQHAVATAKGFDIAEHALSLYAHCTKHPCPNRPVPPARPGRVDPGSSPG